MAKIRQTDLLEANMMLHFRMSEHNEIGEQGSDERRKILAQETLRMYTPALLEARGSRAEIETSTATAFYPDGLIQFHEVVFRGIIRSVRPVLTRREEVIDAGGGMTLIFPDASSYGFELVITQEMDHASDKELLKSEEVSVLFADIEAPVIV